MVNLAHNPKVQTDVPPRRKVVGLVRVSTVAQSHEDRGGMPRQRAVIDATVERQNLDCLRVYEIADSGTDVLRNPTVLEILQMVKVGVVTGLVVADLDRLFRADQPTDYAILQVFKDTGATIFSGDSEYNLQQKDSALFANIRSAISGFELALMKERQYGACEARRKDGKCPTNQYTLPLGVSYDRAKQEFYYNDQIGKVIELFRLFDSGIHCYRELQRRTGVFSITARNLLRNHLYTGWRNITEKRGAKAVSRTGKTYRKKTKRKEDEVIKRQVIVPGAVSQELFDRVQVIMDRTVRNHHESRRRDEAFNIATGIARCAICGEPLYCCSAKRSSGNRFNYYQCKANYYLYKPRLGGCRQPNIPQPELDRLIKQFAVDRLTDPKTLSAIINDAVRKATDVLCPFPAQPNAETELQQLERREERLIDSMEAGYLTTDEFGTRRDRIKREIAEVKRRHAPVTEKPSMEMDQFARLIVRGAMRLRRLNAPREEKAIIHAIFEEVYVRDASITAFKLRGDLPVPAGQVGEAIARAAIQLPAPFRLRPPEQPLPAGQARCSCCREIKPTDQFYRGRGECKECLSAKAHAAHLRRKKAKKAVAAQSGGQG